MKKSDNIISKTYETEGILCLVHQWVLWGNGLLCTDYTEPADEGSSFMLNLSLGGEIGECYDRKWTLELRKTTMSVHVCCCTTKLTM